LEKSLNNILQFS